MEKSGKEKGAKGKRVATGVATGGAGKGAGKDRYVNIHAGHRERLRAQIAKSGISDMPDHVVLEYLLFHTIPRIDTNPLAHLLIDRFGSLTGVFDADMAELLKVPGVGENTACFLKSFALIHERYAMEKIKGHERFSIEALAGFLIDYFLNKTDEEVFVFCLDNGGGLVGKESVYHGSINSTYVSPRALLETVCRYGAVSIILAHNHPSGNATPSSEDITLTRQLMDAFIPFGVTIRAHLVVAGDKYTDIVPIIYEEIKTKPRYIAVRAPEPPLETAAPAPAASKPALNSPAPETPTPETPRAAEPVSSSAEDAPAIRRLYQTYGVEHKN